jgi:predicted transcriptional regulator
MSERKIIRVGDVMKDHYILMHGTDTVETAIETLLSHKADTVFIHRRDDMDEYGIVLLADIAKKVLAKDRAPSRVNLYEIMSKPVLAVDPEMDIRYCARLFDQFGLSTAPVIRDKTIIGVVTYYEIVLQGLVDYAR